MTPNREADVKSITRRNWKAVISRFMKISNRASFVVDCVGRLLKYELSRCISDSNPSVLRTSDPRCLFDFTWDTVIAEARKTMPYLLRILRQCTKTPTERTNTDAIIAIVISILCKQLRPQSCI